MAQVGVADDIPITVPDGDSTYDIGALVADMGESALTQILRMQRRMRKQRLSQSAFDATQFWDVDTQKVRMIGEVNAYFQITLVRKGFALVIPTGGELTDDAHLGDLDEQWRPKSQADLASGDAGRMAAGYVLNNGGVYLSSMANGYDIQVGDKLTLGGMFPLDDFIDAED